ncbi:MAG: DUF418 domain-containing protein [Pseudomonadota bacterium]
MSERAYMPDYLRLFALFGIVIVNVQGMAYPLAGGFSAASAFGPLDRVVVWLIDGLAFFKTYGLFSFMFGVGLAFQMRAAERRDLAFGPLYRNRMLGLFALGLAHGCLLFAYDILVLYALTGALLFLIRGWRVRALLRLAAGLLLVQIVVSSVVLVAPTPDDFGEIERQILTEGGFLDVTVFRTVAFLSTLPYLLVLQGPTALGWFAIGLAAVKSGLIDKPEHPHWRRARRWCLRPGVAASLIGAALIALGATGVGTVVVLAAAPLATMGYLGVIAAVARAPGPVAAWGLTAGGASLSIYLGQSLILATVFAPYGLGLWDAVPPSTAVALALAVTVALILALALWRTWFAMGPFEWVLRRITYLGQVTRR